MGTGAGTKLLKEIGNAQHSVNIISPYLSPKMIAELVWLHNKGVKVRLITSDTLGNASRKHLESIQKLVVQLRTLDQDAQRKRQRWMSLERWLTYGGILLAIVLVGLFWVIKNPFFSLGFALPILLYGISKNLKQKIRSKQIYQYSYSALFPFRAFIAPDKNRINNKFIHGKVYSIDGHTAYMGSLNFTESGTKYNYETRVRVTNIDAIQEIDAEFDALFHDPDLAFFGPAEWGKSLYAEPIH